MPISKIGEDAEATANLTLGDNAGEVHRAEHALSRQSVPATMPPMVAAHQWTRVLGIRP